jgi:hypothetical protein
MDSFIDRYFPGRSKLLRPATDMVSYEAGRDLDVVMREIYAKAYEEKKK